MYGEGHHYERKIEHGDVLQLAEPGKVSSTILATLVIPDSKWSSQVPVPVLTY